MLSLLPLLRSTAARSPLRCLCLTRAYNGSGDNILKDMLKADRLHPPRVHPDHFPPSPPPPSRALGNIAPRYSLHVYSSRNNTIATFTRPGGNVITWSSGGLCGFKKSQRSGYEAGYQVTMKIFKRIEQVLRNETAARVDLYLKGFGQGRDAVQKALLSSEGDFIRSRIMSVTDRTPLKIGGARAKKARRL